MREIDVSIITEKIAQLCIKANKNLPTDVLEAIQVAKSNETWPIAKETLDYIEQNVEQANKNDLPICQDTGMAVVFIELGQDVHLIGGLLEDAVNKGVALGYEEGYLRKSVVADPLSRINTKNNTPALLTVHLVAGDKIHITVAPKGFGSENMSRVAMLKPAQGRQGIIDFILETVKLAGPNPCPPIVLGVGIGGSFDKVTLLAKEALLQPINISNTDSYYASMENEVLEKINVLGIGPAGYGGKSTALSVAIKSMPTHIAALPVAVNISCHVTRRADITI